MIPNIYKIFMFFFTLLTLIFVQSAKTNKQTNSFSNSRIWSQWHLFPFSWKMLLLPRIVASFTMVDYALSISLFWNLAKEDSVLFCSDTIKFNTGCTVVTGICGHEAPPSHTSSALQMSGHLTLTVSGWVCSSVGLLVKATFLQRLWTNSVERFICRLLPSQ